MKKITKFHPFNPSILVGILCWLCLINHPANTQSHKQDSFKEDKTRKATLDIGFGIETSPYHKLQAYSITQDAAESFLFLLTLGLYNDPIYISYYDPKLAWSAGIHLPVSHRFNIFLGLTTQKILEEIKLSGNTVAEGYHKMTSVTFGIDYVYMDRPGCRLYSGVSIGAFMQKTDFDSNAAHETEKISSFSPQINLFGVRFGRSLGVSTEFGWGNRGMVNVGLSKTI